MPNDPILHLLGLAKKAGRLEIGEEPVGAACRARQARLILLAADAAPNTCRRAAHFGEAGNVLWLETPFSKGELGFILGRSSCAMLALTDAGFSAAVVEKLAAQDPEGYEEMKLWVKQKARRWRESVDEGNSPLMARWREEIRCLPGFAEEWDSSQYLRECVFGWFIHAFYLRP